MALKILTAIATAVGLKQPELKDKATPDIAAKDTPPWEGPEQLIAPATGQVCTDHTRNPQTGRCISCGVPLEFGSQFVVPKNLLFKGAEKAPEVAKTEEGTPVEAVKGPVTVAVVQPTQPPAPQEIRRPVSNLKVGTPSSGAGQPVKSRLQVLGHPVVATAAPGAPVTILTAIKELSEGRKGTLMLVSKKSGEGFKVESIYDQGPGWAHVMLKGSNGMTFRPKVGAREVPLYDPVWR